jgi:F-type H+-transporting ATPase subunit b
MTEIFLDRLRKLDSAQITALKSAFKSSSDTLHVRTAFKLSAEQRASIEACVAEILRSQEPVDFIIVPDLVSGIELSSDGRKIAWSVADYLDSMARSVDDLLKNEPEAEVSFEANAAAATVQGADNNEH